MRRFGSGGRGHVAPDQRLVAIQVLETAEDDSLVDDLLESNPEFRTLVAKSKAGPRKPFPPDRRRYMSRLR